MKIKDLLNSVDSLNTRFKIANRVKKCSTRIRMAIAQLYRDKILPKIELGIQSPDGTGYMEISSFDLVNLYGMENLSALLFLDDLYKANLRADKKDLHNLLGMLSNGKHQSNMVVTEELLEQVRQNSPDVWESYQGIVEDENSRTQELAEDYEQIIDEDI